MKKSYRALIIDDERLARNDLKSLLSTFPGVQVVGEADDVPSAVEAVQKLNPDLIFLDIQMPGESGFDLLDKIESPAKVIFVTAYDEYAIRAFEVNALDYLLKPVNPERLALSLERIEQKDLEHNRPLRKLDYKDRMFLMIGSQFRFLRIDSILSIHAAGDYSEIKTTDGKKSLTLKPMKEWESRLPEKYFVRIHRSTIINMEYIERVEEWFNYSFRVYLKGSEEPYVISRRYASKIKEKLG
jgi:two-component system LytT family response regulator